VPTVTTVFDFSPLSHRAVHQPVVRAAFEDAWTSASAHSRGFITLSDATARQVRSRIDGRRPVWRIPAGLSAPFDRPLASATTPRTGVLTVGTIEPRKSIDTVLEAARRLAASGRCVPVTLVGKRGWGYPDFESDLARTPAARWLGYVDDETLLACYQGAAIAAFPSVLEGFGLPVLEAMAQGALPLISADESMTEVVGTSGLQVPGSPEAWADAIGHWLDDDDRRTKMAAQLAERARGFTWAAAARASVQAYEAIA
jgi:glycosyltransferase involved in cell wall biosynthesis